jgi:hypothetical protein
MKQHFSDDVLGALHKDKILGIRAGRRAHRFIGLWMVVVERRLFVRSWALKPDGWYWALRAEPRGVIQIADREIPVRAVRTRSERLKDAVSAAYRTKYDTPGALKYVRDMNGAKSRATTIELIPVGRGKQVQVKG